MPSLRDLVPFVLGLAAPFGALRLLRAGSEAEVVPFPGLRVRTFADSFGFRWEAGLPFDLMSY